MQKKAVTDPDNTFAVTRIRLQACEGILKKAFSVSSLCESAGTISQNVMSAKTPSRGRGAPVKAQDAETAKARILVVDDHPIVREGLVRVIDQTPDLIVCGHAENIPQAVVLLDNSKPDLVIVDISLGGQNGIELIKDIKVRHPALPVLVHSMFDETMYAERCLRAGAKGYVMKHEPPQRLLEAVRQVLK